jgi:hypothetical protein
MIGQFLYNTASEAASETATEATSEAATETTSEDE